MFFVVVDLVQSSNPLGLASLRGGFVVQGSVLVRPGCILRADAYSARGSSVMKNIIERAIIFSTFVT